VVSHPKPYHLDDFLSVSLLLYKYPGAVHRVARNRDDVYRILEEEKPDLAIVVDVGERYDVGEKVRWYDHHQDASLPCSLVLVLRHEFPDLYRKILEVEPLRKMLQYLDTRDRFGVDRANEVLGIRDPIDLMRYLPTIFLTEPSPEVGKNFVKLVEAFYRAKERARVLNVDGVKVAIIDLDQREVPASVVFDVTGADLLIQRNSRNPRHTNVMKNNRSPLYDKIDLSKLARMYPIVFLHKNGFLAVLDVPIESLSRRDIEDIVRTILAIKENKEMIEA